MISYGILACSGVYAGDLTCDFAGDIDPSTGTYGPTLDVTNPALTFDPLVVAGFFGGGSVPVSVDARQGTTRASSPCSRATHRMTSTRW